MQTLQLLRIGSKENIMLEDLLELRRILDRFIAKYQEQDKYRFEHDPRIVEDFKLQDDERLKDLGQELLKDKDNNLNNDGFWRGNDVY